MDSYYFFHSGRWNEMGGKVRFIDWGMEFISDGFCFPEDLLRFFLGRRFIAGDLLGAWWLASVNFCSEYPLQPIGQVRC